VRRGAGQRKLYSKKILTGTAAAVVLFILFIGTLKFQRQSKIPDLYKSEYLSSQVAVKLQSRLLADRLQGLLAIEQRLSDNPQESERTLDTLELYIRNNAPWPASSAQLNAVPDHTPASAGDASSILPADIHNALSMIKELYNEELLAGGHIIDLHQCNLSFADLRSAYLPHAKLWKSNLHKALIEKAYLANSELLEARLSQISALEANLYRADLWKADLEGAILIKSYMVHVNLGVANLKRANLSGADLRQSNMQSADLENAILMGTNLNGANLSRARLLSAKFNGAEMQNVILNHANINQASFQGADLKGANFTDATAIQANLRNANLERAVLNGANFKGADLREIHLRVFDPLCETRSLYAAKLDRIIISFIDKKCPRLLKP
jgi:uncharacterized protein YjbI with pentapeptide repeats